MKVNEWKVFLKNSRMTPGLVIVGASVRRSLQAEASSARPRVLNIVRFC